MKQFILEVIEVGLLINNGDCLSSHPILDQLAVLLGQLDLGCDLEEVALLGRRGRCSDTIDFPLDGQFIIAFLFKR